MGRLPRVVTAFQPWANIFRPVRLHSLRRDKMGLWFLNLHNPRNPRLILFALLRLCVKMASVIAGAGDRTPPR
jgi:hypothetical protein